MAELDDLGSQQHPVGVGGVHLDLVDVEAEVVEPLDPLLHAPELAAAELLLLGQLGPERVVLLLEALDDGVRVDIVAQVAALEQVEQLGEDVLGGDRDVVLPHLVGECRPELAGLGVDEVRREVAGAAPEQHVGEGHVAPEEVRQVQPDQQHHLRVDQRRQLLRVEAVGEQPPVGHGVLQVPGHQHRWQRFAVGRLAARDHALRDHDREAEAAQVAEDAVLAVRHLGHRLLGDVRRAAGAGADDADHVAREPSGERHEVLVVPLLERGVPGHGKQRRVGSRCHEVKRHAPSIPSVGRFPSPVYRGSRKTGPGPRSATTSSGLRSRHFWRLRQPQPMQPSRLSRSFSMARICSSSRRPPRGAEPGPVLLGGRAPGGQGGERLGDLVEGEPDPLGRADEGHPAQGGLGVAALVAGGARGLDQPARLVEADRRGGDTRPLGELPDRQHGSSIA